jgi:hypothetical protein
MAAAARAEPGPLGLCWRQEEGDIFAKRVFGRARRTAVDAGGTHRRHELAVGAGIAPEHELPALIVGEEGVHAGIIRQSRFGVYLILALKLRVIIRPLQAELTMGLRR